MLARPRSFFRPLPLLTLLLPALALSRGLRFTTLDIGQGDSAVLIAPGGCVALFDGGPTGSGPTLKAYLKSLGVTRIGMAFVSRLHADHMGGIDEVDVGTDAVPIDGRDAFNIRELVGQPGWRINEPQSPSASPGERVNGTTF